MAENIAPTKGNLISLKNSLSLAQNGYELMDRKRNILVRETMELIDSAKEIQSLIVDAYIIAYDALQKANIDLGAVDELALSCQVDDSLKISNRSVMGVVIPKAEIADRNQSNRFGYCGTSESLDIAVQKFNEVKRLTVRLAEIESSIYRLAAAIRKTQKRANALKNIVIPRFMKQVSDIAEVLDEREREEFSRLKVIKKTHGA
ncbi:MAG: V-type ATP synthase subunit D [Oscillospiraceae bacterium]|nr:V-type ATP synthase subunit D [Candidatus Equicaccousia limihippi]